MTRIVKISRRPKSMEKHMTVLENQDKSAYVQVAPVTPKAGPMHPIVETLIPKASKPPTPSNAKRSAKKRMKKIYIKK